MIEQHGQLLHPHTNLLLVGILIDNMHHIGIVGERASEPILVASFVVAGTRPMEKHLIVLSQSRLIPVDRHHRLVEGLLAELAP